MIKINKRLATISAFINLNDKVIDIGCDHNMLAIYNYLERKIIIIGSDINKEPLKIAQNNINKYDLSNILSLRLGNGLSTVTDEINTVVISGMGCLTIIDILKDLNNYPNIKKLIISPNNDFPILREKLNKMGLKIIREVMVNENNKYYPVIEYQKGNEDIDYIFGKLDTKDLNTINYFNYLIKTNKKIINVTTDIKRKQLLIEENNKINKTIKGD